VHSGDSSFPIGHIALRRASGTVSVFFNGSEIQSTTGLAAELDELIGVAKTWNPAGTLPSATI